MRSPRSGQLRVLRKCSEAAAASSALSDRLQQDVSSDNSSLSGRMALMRRPRDICTRPARRHPVVPLPTWAEVWRIPMSVRNVHVSIFLVWFSNSLRVENGNGDHFLIWMLVVSWVLKPNLRGQNLRLAEVMSGTATRRRSYSALHMYSLVGASRGLLRCRG